MSTHSSFFSQPTAPGPGSGQGAPSSPTTSGTAPADSGSGGAGAPFSGIGMLVMVLPILLIFFTMRGQTKKQKQVESSLKTGDVVITQSGLIGKVTEFIGETRVKVEIAPGVNVRMLKSSISGVDGGEPKPADAKPQEKKA